mmetsp:Transcript_8829/g.13407  ORF Transcript_8829/g.13407 Transcript_8829/m.13407 type:complete len:564 (-) Transcript_8829:85-1776(-)|eukprot:CAMPEP_0201546296 /NCGR_PEP_ID=MMETSP0173_2-20130828/2620_1 /ASSEMBLY_ACC=CAM_ASM_000268 /TAXON_ID=218659 /ORGANISM="Vexillifera sp., Strain DIVA3 564/2" /LENGTH=563 /DNA_ID=CAMNT_0047954919 /DNA_START=22 /DNA_END=1713 /DNA_ORIENTATION=-
MNHSKENKQSKWWQTLLGRDITNSTLSNTEPWKIVIGTLGATAATYVGYQLYQTDDALKSIGSFLIQGARFIPGVEGQINKETQKMLAEVEEGLVLKDDPCQYFTIPQHGLSADEVLKLMSGLLEKEEHHWRSGKVSGVVYLGDDNHSKLLSEAYSMYALSNPLHPEVFPSVRKYESEIVAMTIHMLGGDIRKGHVGTVTSGGTESIIMALKAYRDRARAKQPHIKQAEVVVADTAHAAFNKGCQYFNMKLVTVPCRKDTFQIDLEAAERAINKNTVLVVGSACCYSTGTIDNIQALGEIAQRHNIGLHVDGCLGGYILPWMAKAGFDIPPFDLSVPGVTSMSADTHKYGYATKGTSVVMFNSADLRKYMYFVDTEWTGGIYASAGVAGSRPGGLVATCWASLVAMGQDGYTKVARGIGETQRAIKQAIVNDFDKKDLVLMGDSVSSVVAFNSPSFNIFKVLQGMNEAGWNLNAIQKPNGVHVCVTAPMIGKHVDFIKDLHAVVDTIKNSSDAHAGGEAVIYGMATSIPDRSLVKDMISGYLDILTKPIEQQQSSNSASSSSA